MQRSHNYKVSVKWTGNNGTGTSGYADYGRNHTITSPGKPDIDASADTPFRGDAARHNPETLLLSALSTCHMLWYLHLCADAGIIVTDYTDDAEGVLVLPETGSGHFSSVVLRPVVTITNAEQAGQANALHHKANEKCFIANSVNFTVHHEPVCVAAG